MANVRVLTDLDNININNIVADFLANNPISINSDVLFIDNVTNKVGINNNNPQYDLHILGSFAATTKSFVIPHPLQESNYKSLRYGSLESPYHGIRLTGKDIIIDGICKVLLPDYISKLVSDENINIQLTNYRHDKVLFVDEINLSNNSFIVKSYSYSKLEFFWSFTAIRVDIEPMIVEF